MTPIIRVPNVPDGFAQHLREVFPTKVDVTYDLRQYDLQVGQQAVIDYIEKLWGEQNPKE